MLWRRGAVRADHPCAVTGRTGGRRVTNQVVNVIFKLSPAHLEFFDFLVGGEIDLLFDAVNRVVQSVILIEHLPEMIIRAFQAADDLTMFREFSQDRMMKVHGLV